MGLGIIGLGNTGTNMVQRLRKVGHQCVVYDVHSVSVQTLANEDAVEVASVEDFVNQLSKPRALWIMMPAAAVDATLNVAIPHLGREDVVINGGTSYYRDHVSRTTELKSKGIHYVDIGTRGSDNEHGYYMMIDGATSPPRDPVWPPLKSAVSVPIIDPEAHVAGRGNPGSVHDRRTIRRAPHGPGRTQEKSDGGIKYGLTAAYTQIMTILHHENGGVSKRDAEAITPSSGNGKRYEHDLTVDEIGENWRRGSVISSWLLEMAARALVDSPGLEKFAVRMSDSAEGRWTVIAAIDESAQVPVLTAALYERFGPLGKAVFADTVLSALRSQCGYR